MRAGSGAHAAQAASAFSIHCTPRKALHASLAQQAAERRAAAAGGLRPGTPSMGSAEGDRRASEAEAGAAGRDGASPGERADAGADGGGAPRAGPKLAPVERGGSGASTSGRTGSGAIELPVLPWSDWEIPADEIRICRRPNGAEWELGSGAFGKARRAQPACASVGRAWLEAVRQCGRRACPCPCLHVRPMVSASSQDACRSPENLAKACPTRAARGRSRARRRLGPGPAPSPLRLRPAPGAQVFKAVRGGVQFVAVKVLHDLSEEQSSDFGHEIAVLKSCRHPNIVQFQARAPFDPLSGRPRLHARACRASGRALARTPAPRADSRPSVTTAQAAAGTCGTWPRLASR